MAVFDSDLFISYAHIDNLPLTSEQEGWISRFHQSLEAFLSMRLGKAARIWRDDKLQGNDVFADEIVSQFDKTAVLLSVLTPRYVNSEWCSREISTFCEQAEHSGGVVIDQKARVFKVLKTPVRSEASLPPVVQGLLGYEFFTIDDGAPLELDTRYGEAYAQDYHRKVNKLAFDISQLLHTLDDAVEPASASAGSSPADTVADAPTAGGDRAVTVYLAECSFDRREHREAIEGELVRMGHTVLPDRQLPRDEADYTAAVAELLQRCDLSIHLIGDHYGAVPDGPGHRSVPEWQNALAASHSKATDMPRLVWLPATTRPEHDRQRNFVDALLQSSDSQAGADLISGEIAALKTALYATLAAIDSARQRPSAPATDDDRVADAPLVYLVCTEADRKATVPLRKFCRDRGVLVSLPAFKGDAAAVRAANESLMARCDAVMLFYGHGEEAWKRTVDNELKKLPAYRQGRAMPLSFTYLAAPATCDKDDLIDMEEDNLIDALEQMPESALEAMVRTIA